MLHIEKQVITFAPHEIETSFQRIQKIRNLQMKMISERIKLLFINLLKNVNQKVSKMGKANFTMTIYLYRLALYIVRLSLFIDITCDLLLNSCVVCSRSFRHIIVLLVNREHYYRTMRLILLISFFFLENTAVNLDEGKITTALRYKLFTNTFYCN